MKETTVNYVETIVENSLAIINGFNVIRAEKHLKNLIVSPE